MNLTEQLLSTSRQYFMGKLPWDSCINCHTPDSPLPYPSPSSPPPLRRLNADKVRISIAMSLKFPKIKLKCFLQKTLSVALLGTATERKRCAYLRICCKRPRTMRSLR